MSQPTQYTESTVEPRHSTRLSPQHLSRRYEWESQPFYANKTGLWNFMLWFLLAAIIIYGLIAFFNPAFVQNVNPTTGQPNGTLNQTTAIVTAIIGGLIVVFIIYLFRESYKY